MAELPWLFSSRKGFLLQIPQPPLLNAAGFVQSTKLDIFWLPTEPSGSLLHSLLITCLPLYQEPWGCVPSTYNLGIAKPHLWIHLALRLLSLWQIINQVRDTKNIYTRRCCISFGSCPHIESTVLLSLVALLQCSSSRRQGRTLLIQLHEKLSQQDLFSCLLWMTFSWD